MFIYEKKLQFPVKIATPNPKLAAFIISQYGGPDGELGASMRYLSQRYAMPYAEAKGVLTDIGTEELGHMEMVAAIVHQLTRNLTADQIKDEMCATLGGRAAEQIIFGKISTGALSDLEKVSRQAMAMVTVYGLNEKIGNITYYDSTGQRDYGFTKPYSEKTAQIIDEEISKIVEEQYQRALKILSDNRDKLTRLAEMLLEREVIFKEDLIEIFGPRPFPDVEDGQEAPASDPKAAPSVAQTSEAEQTTGDGKTPLASDASDAQVARPAEDSSSDSPSDPSSGQPS